LYVEIQVFPAWWVVLFTGKYPDYMLDWVSGQIRWQIRLSLYMMYMTVTYPPFTGDELPDEV